MEVYRITQSAFANDLSGKGSWMFGGRWNSEGVFALYTSQSRSLALLENLVHTPFSLLKERPYEVVTIFIPDELPIYTIDTRHLPENWDAYGGQSKIRSFGDVFLADTNCTVLKVPGALIPEEFNYIINPQSVFASKVTIASKKPFTFNDRLLQSF